MKKCLFAAVMSLLVLVSVMPPGLAADGPGGSVTADGPGDSVVSDVSQQPEDRVEDAEPQPVTAEQLLKETIILTVGSHAAVADGGVTSIYFVAKEVVPYVREGCAFVPLRFLCERLGCTVDWDNPSQTAIVERDGRVFTVQIGSDCFTADGETRPLEGSTELVCDRTMVSARFISEGLGLQVDREGEFVIITPPELGWQSENEPERAAIAEAERLLMMYSMFV